MNDLTIPANSAVSIIQSAIASGADPAYLRELLQVRREWEAMGKPDLNAELRHAPAPPMNPEPPIS